MTNPTYTLHQYWPSVVDWELRYKSGRYKSADTIEKILTAPWVVKWMQKPNFYRLAEIKEKDSCVLMVHLDDGYTWHMIGILTRSDDVQPTFDLPVHEVKYRDKELKND